MTTVPAGYEPSPWWSGAAPHPRPPLVGDVRVDYVVVGAGLAGLAAAYFLRRNRPDATVVVLEANRVGSGATGASTGIVAPGVGGPITVLRRRYGDRVAAATFAGSVTAVARTVELVEREHLDCDLELNGQLVCAVSARQDRALRAQHRSFAELGFDIPYLPARELAERFGGRPYRSALRHPLAATLDPVRLSRSLAGVLTGLGVTIHERSPVLSIRPGVPVQLRCPSGIVRARHVVMATDGVQPEGLGSAGVVPITGHVIRTDPLTDRQLDRIGWLDRDSVVDCRTFFNYYRLTPDHRIIMGGGRVTLPPGIRGGVGSTTAWNRIEHELRTIFPDLASVPVSDRWSGRIGSVLDRMPRLGRLPAAPGVWFTGGWCGHGIPLSVQAGYEIARRITGVAGQDDVAWYREKVLALPGGPPRDWGLQAYLAGLDRRDRMLHHFGAVGREFVRPPVSARLSGAHR
ncbi:MAG: FAD-binding oxidoreductase [Nakamurella multipartita]